MKAFATRFTLSPFAFRNVAPMLFLLWLLLWFSASPLAQTQTGASAAAGAANQAEMRTLKLGEPVERELAGGQSQAYQITLSAGQYLNVLVEQRGIDVAAVLFAPDGKQIFEFDNERRLQSPETIWQVAEMSGSFRLTVRATQEEARAGRYEIRLVELRAATEQDRALQEARTLYAEGDRLLRAGKYDEARSLIERSLEMRERTLGTEHSDVAQSLNSLGNIYRVKRDFDKAEPLYLRALTIREKALGPEHPDVSVTLHSLALLYHNKRDYEKAEPLYLRALVIREKALGQEHIDVATYLNNLAGLYFNKSDYDKAEPLYIRALAIREKVLGLDNPVLADSLNNLGTLYSRKRDTAKAELLYLRALAIQEKALRPDHPDVVSSLKRLGGLYFAKGDYAKAEPFYERALAIQEKTLKPDHPDLVGSLKDVATLYFLKSDYLKAEPLYLRILAIQEKALGPDHRDVGDSLNKLATLYFTKGDYIKAEPLFQRALAIQEKAYGPDNIFVRVTLTLLASLYRLKGDYAKAEPLYQRALAIQGKASGPDNIEMASLQKDVANLYLLKSDYDKAEPLLQRLLAFSEKNSGPDSLVVAGYLGNLGNVYRAKGDYDKAESLYQRALSISEKALGPENTTVLASLDGLATLHRAKGDFAQSLNFRARANAVSERNLAINLAAGSERQKLAYLAIFSEESDTTVSLHVGVAPNNASARNQALSVILQRKGRALDAMTDSIAALRRRANADDRALLDQLQTTAAQLAGIVLKSSQGATPAENQARIKSLEAQKEKLESDISRRSAEFRVQAAPVTIETVQAAIPAQSALVEFASYRPFNPKYQKVDERFGAPRYVAYVLHPQGEAQWVELGEAKPIDDAVEKLRQALRDKRRKDVKQLARAVDEKVMRPVRGLLGQTRRVFISPDGSLNLIPFAALVDEHNQYLVRRYEFSYLTSGRDLLRLQVKQPNKQTALVVANPDFGPDISEDAQAGAARQRGLVYHAGTKKATTDEGAVLAGYYFPPLQGTAGEARALETILKDATVLTQAQATEAALKQVSSPRILHIATHGFFLENAKAAQVADRGLRPVSLNEPQVTGPIENPLLRSGLALAGANRQKSGDGDDGILTAQEAAGLDLWGTKLVVLSACDTGVGEVKNGEGVYGLRRALVLAGSETQVMSLWPVSDKGTRDLMIEYYRRLLRGEGRSAALRAVQLRMLTAQPGTARNYSHPYYWASFIQSGEWRRLD